MEFKPDTSSEKLLPKSRPHFPDNSPGCGIPKPATLENFRLINGDAKLSETALNSFYFQPRFILKFSRHTGGYQLFHWSN